jgi:hypothetical protein
MIQRWARAPPSENARYRSVEWTGRSVGCDDRRRGIPAQPGRRFPALCFPGVVWAAQIRLARATVFTRAALPHSPSFFPFVLMRYSSRLALGLLLAAPLRSFAQTLADAAPAVPPHRFYVGLGAYHSNFQNLGSWRQGDTGFRVPVQLTAGYQLRPRLALELGVAYSGRTSVYAYDSYYYNTSGIAPANYQYSRTTTERVASVSALARYTLTRKPAHRLQFDALGGFTLVHGNVYSRGFEANDFAGSFQAVPFDNHSTHNELLLTAGLGLRYRLTPRFEVNFDLTTNRNLNHPHTYQGFTGSAALGLRYRFGK